MYICMSNIILDSMYRVDFCLFVFLYENFIMINSFLLFYSACSQINHCCRFESPAADKLSVSQVYVGIRIILRNEKTQRYKVARVSRLSRRFS